MEEIYTDPLREFNQLYREVDELYHRYAKAQGISDMTLWLLYSLYEREGVYTQRELCAAWHCPPQTLNSALKSLEAKGLILLQTTDKNRKNKQVLLTEQGRAVAQSIIAPLMLAERRALQSLGEAEQAALLTLTRRYVELLQAQINGR